MAASTYIRITRNNAATSTSGETGTWIPVSDLDLATMNMGAGTRAGGSLSFTLAGDDAIAIALNKHLQINMVSGNHQTQTAFGGVEQKYVEQGQSGGQTFSIGGWNRIINQQDDPSTTAQPRSMAVIRASASPSDDQAPATRTPDAQAREAQVSTAQPTATSHHYAAGSNAQEFTFTPRPSKKRSTPRDRRSAACTSMRCRSRRSRPAPPPRRRLLRLAAA